MFGRSANAMHDISTPKTEIPMRWLIGVIGKRGYLVFQSRSIYIQSHVILHHPMLGNPEKDPDVKPLIKAGLYDSNFTERRYNLFKFIIQIFDLTKNYEYISYLIENRIFNKYEDKKERFARLTFYLTLVCLMINLDIHLKTKTIQIFFMYWIFPFLTIQNVIGYLIELSEHYPLFDFKRKQTDIYMSRNRIFGYVFDFIFSQHDEGYHLVHHLFPSLPNWKFKEAHQVLM